MLISSNRLWIGTGNGVIISVPLSEGKWEVTELEIKGLLYPFLISRHVHPYHLDESISSFRGSWWMFSFLLNFA